jgi:predicted PolB exonuclease-like 3'-5' exonuclease
LSEVAIILGLPGKMGMSGAQVWEYYLAGKIEEIRNYCETDVLNTYLIYLRWELIRGNLDQAGWENEQRYPLPNQNHARTPDTRRAP